MTDLLYLFWVWQVGYIFLDFIVKIAYNIFTVDTLVTYLVLKRYEE